MKLVEHFGNIIIGRFMNELGNLHELRLHFCEVILPKEYFNNTHLPYN